MRLGRLRSDARTGLTFAAVALCLTLAACGRGGRDAPGDKDLRAVLGTVPKDIDVIYASLWAPDAALMPPPTAHAMSRRVVVS